ncbi:MAG: LysR substrate-binding domain-containing protein [Alphaproteobacteria bacterium]
MSEREPERIQYLNFNQLRSFYAVAQHLSFTRAAQALNVGQPTVTTQVKALEDYYRVELFQRLPGGVALSESGAALLALARRIFQLEEEAIGLLESLGGGVVGTLRVGSVGPFFVMKLLAALRATHPRLALTLRTGNSEAILNDVLEGRLDVGVVGDAADDSRLDAVPLQRQAVIVFVARRHRWARRSAIALAELDGEPLVMREPGSRTREVFERALRTARVKPNIVLEVPREAVREAVAEGLGVGILSEAEFTPDPRLRALRLADADAATEAFAVCLQSRRNVRPIAGFMALATSYAELSQG